MEREAISSKAYDIAERWSSDIVSSHDVLFNPQRFRQAIKQSAKEIKIPEVVSLETAITLQATWSRCRLAG